MAMFYKIHKMPELKNQWMEMNKSELKNLSEEQISRKYDLHLSTEYKKLSVAERQKYNDKATDLVNLITQQKLEYMKREEDFANKNMAEASEKFGRKYSQLDGEDGVIKNDDMAAALRKAAEDGFTEEGDANRNTVSKYR